MKIRAKFCPWPPWAVIVNVGNTTTLGGISRDIYEAMKGPLNIDFKINLQEDFIFGALAPDGKWNGMLGSMQRNESDISGPYFITEERANLVDFSVPVSFSQLAIMSGLVPANRDPWLIFRIFTLKVWLLAVLSTLLVSAVAALIYLVVPSTSKKSKPATFLKYVWMFYGTLLGKEYGSEKRWFLRHVLTAASFRLLLCVWLTGPALILMYTYQGAITSTFASDKLKPKIESMEQLDESKSIKMGTLPNSYPTACFERLKGTRFHSLSVRVKENYKNLGDGSFPEWLNAIENGEFAFVAEVSMMKTVIGNRFKESGRCGIYITPVDFCSAYMAFALSNNFRPKLQKKFNKRLLRFTEGRLFHRQMIASLSKYDICTRVKARTVKPLSLIDLLSAFIVYSAGIFASLIVFFVEKAVKWRKSLQK